VALVLGLTSVHPIHAQSRDAEMEKMKAMMQEMAKTIQTLQGRVADLEKEKGTGKKGAPSVAGLLTKPSTEVVNAAVPAQTSNTTDRDTFLDEQWPAPRVNNAPIDPSLNGFIPIPGTKTIVRLGGNARLDAIYDFGNNGNPNLFIPSSIPVPGESGFGGAERSQIEAKGSRISLELRRPIGESNNLRIYYENDFFNDSASSSMNYRLRHFYGQAFNLLVGQTFSTFMDPDAFPDVVDYQGPNGLVNTRSPQIRYTQPFLNYRLQLAVSAEQPNGQIDTDDPLFGTDAAVFNRIPDFAAQIRYEDKKWGHLQLSGIYRILSYENNVRRDDATGWGVSFAGALNVFKNDTLTFQATYGEGIGRYIQDSSGLNLDAGLDELDALKAIPIFAAAAGYTHQWTEKWKSTVSYGFVNADAEFSNGPFALQQSQYVSANLIYQVTSSFRMGLEYLYGTNEVQNGADADAHRLNFVFKYNLVR
jgi:hypothetical protein